MQSLPGLRVLLVGPPGPPSVRTSPLWFTKLCGKLASGGVRASTLFQRSRSFWLKPTLTRKPVLRAGAQVRRRPGHRWAASDPSQGAQGTCSLAWPWPLPWPLPCSLPCSTVPLILQLTPLSLLPVLLATGQCVYLSPLLVSGSHTGQSAPSWQELLASILPLSVVPGAGLSTQ